MPEHGLARSCSVPVALGVLRQRQPTPDVRRAVRFELRRHHAPHRVCHRAQCSVRSGEDLHFRDEHLRLRSRALPVSKAFRRYTEISPLRIPSVTASTRLVTSNFS